MDRPHWAPPTIDIDKPSAARMYDYYLGGSHNFASDRRAADAAMAVSPGVVNGCKANRAFLQRAVRELVAAGVRQFLDIGSGIPTVGNVHEIALAMAPDSRIAYIDTDSVAVLHGRQLLADQPNVVVVQEDLRDPQRVLNDPDVRGLLNFDEPIALLLLAVLHFVPDEARPNDLVASVRDALAPGSYLALSHGIHEIRPEESATVSQVYTRTANPLTLRTREEVDTFFTGWEVLDPGLVWLVEWRPDPNEPRDEHPELQGMYGGLAQLG